MKAGPLLRRCDEIPPKTILLEKEVPFLLCTKTPTNPLGSPDTVPVGQGLGAGRPQWSVLIPWTMTTGTERGSAWAQLPVES